MKAKISNLKRSLPVLNRHPAFRKAVERVLTRSQAEAIGLSVESKCKPDAINKLFDGVKPYKNDRS